VHPEFVGSFALRRATIRALGHPMQWGSAATKCVPYKLHLARWSVAHPAWLDPAGVRPGGKSNRPISRSLQLCDTDCLLPPRFIHKEHNDHKATGLHNAQRAAMRLPSAMGGDALGTRPEIHRQP